MAKSKEMAKNPEPIKVSNDTMALLTGNTGPLKPLQDIGGSSSPYVMFIHPNSPQFANVVAALGKAPDTGTAIYVNAGEYMALSDFKFILLTEIPLQYFGDFASNGDIKSAALAPVDRVPMTEKNKPFKEGIEAIILVIDEGTLMPARVSFRGPKCPAVKTAASARQDCDLPEFSGRSKDHKTIANSKTPKFLWHTMKCTISTKEPRKTDNDEKEYHLLSAVPELTTVNILAEFGKMMKDKAFMETCQQCLDDYNNRCNEIREIAEKSGQ